MTTTNQAFIDAYRTIASGVGTKPPQPAATAAETVVGSTATAVRVEAAHPAAAPTEGKKPRRPLSQVQADELFGLATAAATEGARWPALCQRLIANAADRYDALLRTLPASNTGLLVGVVGPAEGAGCTTTAICLALRSAACGLSTALVDGNFRAPGLATALGIEHFRSWGDLLASDQSVPPAVRSDDLAEVDLLLATPIEEQALDSTLRFRASLAAGLLRRKYQRVFIDLGVVGSGASQLATDLAAAMGIDVLLASTSPATAAQLTAATATLAHHGLPLTGVVEATAAA